MLLGVFVLFDFLLFWLSLDPIAVGSRRAWRGVALVLELALPLACLAYLARRHRFVLPQGRLSSRAGLWLCAGLAAAVFVLAAIIAVVAMDGFALTGDEVAYLAQARLFAAGKLWDQVPAIEPYISAHYMFPVGDRLISQYPPGWSAMLAVLDRAGLPLVLANPILGAVTVIALYNLAARTEGREVAILACVIMAGSGFFLFNSAGFLNGCWVSLLGIGFVTCVCAFLEAPGLGSAIGIGILWSGIAASRHLDALLYAVPAAFAILGTRPARRLSLLPVAVLAAIPGMVAVLLYYHAVTGHALVLPQTLRNASDGLLGPNWSVHRATEILVGRFVELAEWTSPVFILVLGWAYVQIVRGGKWRFFDVYLPLFLLGYWLYWADGGLRWGPRYIYPAFPFAALLVARVALSARCWAPREAVAPVFQILVLLSVLASAAQLPFLALRAHQVMIEAQDVFATARRAGVHDAVVIAASGTGTIWKIDTGDLARNEAGLQADIVFAHGPDPLAWQVTPNDLRVAIHDLASYFPHRQVWVYRRKPDSPTGELTPAE